MIPAPLADDLLAALDAAEETAAEKVDSGSNLHIKYPEWKEGA